MENASDSFIYHVGSDYLNFDNLFYIGKDNRYLRHDKHDTVSEYLVRNGTGNAVISMGDTGYFNAIIADDSALSFYDNYSDMTVYAK